MNENDNNNLDSTNTIPVVDSNPKEVTNEAVDKVSVEEAKDAENSVSVEGANIVDAASLIGEIPTESTVIPRENLANLDVNPDVNININLGLQPEEKPPTNTAFRDRMKQIELDYKPPSKARIFLLVVFFVLIIGYAFFLPEINSMILKYKSGQHNEEDVIPRVITDGIMKCELTSTKDNLDFDYTSIFTFSDNKLKKVEFNTVIRGDITLDEAVLDEYAETCKLVSKNAKQIEGASVKCDYVSGQLTQKQVFDLSVVDVEKITAAFTEAGGNYPKYDYDQDVDLIQKEVLAGGFSCKRVAK